MGIEAAIQNAVALIKDVRINHLLRNEALLLLLDTFWWIATLRPAIANCGSMKLSLEFVEGPLEQGSSPKHTRQLLTTEPNTSELNGIGGRTSKAKCLQLTEHLIRFQ
ncbi:hypothetical protein PZN02_005360 [Sinorhizobium garamanticum]|uniref:Uncharacterized protein n=1 Tax=Sinorhizobium garamanticum TaxID=680247 RepID=A0ABY8DGJ1_9HYPH|nr:hypothetical protein [Sinorhizobium garamanticum]WEX90018.1 hypothetical protein PZN02_005360 [Sinorhizobium garamanticum]